MDDFKRSQFPAFGNWDYSDGLPITQYFETARHAGLIRYSYGEQDLYGGGSYDLYTSTMTDDHLINKPSITVVPHRKAKAKGAGRPCRQAEQQKKQGKVYDLTIPHSITHRRVPPTNPKAVDEDLYKIPPELLYKESKRVYYSENTSPTDPNKPMASQPLKGRWATCWWVPHGPHRPMRGRFVGVGQSSKKKMFGFLSRCLVPNCAV